MTTETIIATLMGLAILALAGTAFYALMAPIVRLHNQQTREHNKRVSERERSGIMGPYESMLMSLKGMVEESLCELNGKEWTLPFKISITQNIRDGFGSFVTCEFLPDATATRLEVTYPLPYLGLGTRRRVAHQIATCMLREKRKYEDAE